MSSEPNDGQDRPNVSWDLSHGDLKVSDNRRYLIHTDGEPFFYLGDTAWQLIAGLNREDTSRYFDNRAQKGFTVIQTVLLAEIDGLHAGNAYGHMPLVDLDPARPAVNSTGRDDYWTHADWVIDTAESFGLVIGLLPTWGDKVVKAWGDGPVIFNPSNAYQYGCWLGQRYRHRTNLIWINGGDRSPFGHDCTDTRETWHALARGLRDGDHGRHLITYHPSGGCSSSNWFHNDEWLDFNMNQTSHSCRDNPKSYLDIARDYALQPVKPTLDGEPRYEDHPVCGHRSGMRGWFDDFDVRQAAYWSLFAGGFGFTYGCHDIWQMHTPGRRTHSSPRRYWYDALDLPGACHMTHIRKLMTRYHMLSRIPDQEIILSDPGSGADHVRATRGRDYAMVYIPTGKTVTIQPDRIGGDYFDALWFNPQTGEYQAIGRYKACSQQTFYPPVEPGVRGNDRVLVISRSLVI